jgi:hypothetical protein
MLLSFLSRQGKEQQKPHGCNIEHAEAGTFLLCCFAEHDVQSACNMMLPSPE